jgi:hypothetical protein
MPTYGQLNKKLAYSFVVILQYAWTLYSKVFSASPYQWSDLRVNSMDNLILMYVHMHVNS